MSKKRGLSINLDIHHSKVFSSELLSFKGSIEIMLTVFLNRLKKLITLCETNQNNDKSVKF